MGLLTTGGEPMVFGTKEHSKAIPYVKEHGVRQLVHIFHRLEGQGRQDFLWGEELEHLTVSIDPDARRVKLSLTADDVIQALRKKGEGDANPGEAASWLPEYGSFMIETTPREPYTATLEGLMRCETNIAGRYRRLREHLSGTNQRVVTLVAFPTMGTADFVDASPSQIQVNGEYSDSIFIPDICINQTHPRFGNLTRNIRLRRGRKVCIQVPLFIDKHTLDRSVDTRYSIDQHPMNKRIECAPVGGPATKSLEDDSDEENAVHTPAAGSAAEVFSHLYTPATDYFYAQYTLGSDKARNVEARFEACPCPVPSVHHPCVYMDCMAFGMGCSCLQVTMQMANVAEARHVFDQLAVVCPLFLALTAATPVQKGFLCNSDVRWLTIAASVDDRQRAEVPRIIKSRYDSVSLFISTRPDSLESYNDNPVETDPKTMAMLRSEGFDERLARHISHLFIRDPLVMFDRRVEQLDDSKETDHFENIQSTNWQTVRFKPPPPGTDIGWRVEFRVMEVQMTPFENAAHSVFIVLLTRAIIKYDQWFYVPMSKVDVNMGRAHLISPEKAKYWFRKKTQGAAASDECEEMTLDEIFNGRKGGFLGLVPLVRRLIADEKLVDPRMELYLDLISGRASGKYQTTAAFLREFIISHPAYEHDSRVGPAIAHDICIMADRLAAGELSFDSLLPAAGVREGPMAAAMGSAPPKPTNGATKRPRVD